MCYRDPEPVTSSNQARLSVAEFVPQPGRENLHLKFVLTTRYARVKDGTDIVRMANQKLVQAMSGSPSLNYLEG